MLIPFLCYSQQRMNRLALQYQLMDAPENAQEELKLSIAGQYLDEGETANALKFLDQVKDNKHASHKNLMMAKLLFIDDRFRESIVLLKTIDTSNLDAAGKKDLPYMMALNYNHLLRPDSSFDIVNRYLLDNGKDTAATGQEFSAMKVPLQYDLRKARRRSYIPGGGLFYIKERKKAATSLLINTAFLGYAAYSIYTKYYFTAAITGLGQFMRFYGGGRRAAINIGYKKNTGAAYKYILELDRWTEKKIFGL